MLDDQVLTYCPAADQAGLTHAIPYLVRRVDETTSPDNYLPRESFTHGTRLCGMEIGIGTFSKILCGA